MDPVIPKRTLNRAALARQLLLGRVDRPVPDVVEHVGGLQAQTPHTWYTGLWNRIEGFRPEDASKLLESRQLVRIALQRSTIHLVTARDALAMRPLLQVVTERMTRTTFVRKLRGVDLDELAAAGRELVEATPMTFAALGRALAERWPGNDPHALSQVVRWLVPLVQVPPRGLWGRSGPIAHTSAEAWLGFEAPPMTPQELVRRYLAAFGPATVADAARFTILTRDMVREAVKAAGDTIVRLEGPGGAELLDVPGAPLPDEDAPAPPRLLPMWDGVVLAHEPPGRVLTPEVRPAVVKRNGDVLPVALVDGEAAGVWRPVEGDVEVTAFRRLTPAEWDGLAEEAQRLAPVLERDARLYARFGHWFEGLGGAETRVLPARSGG